MRVTKAKIIATILVVAAAVPQEGEGQENFRIGYIDSQAILQEAPGAQQAQQQFNQEMQRFQAEVEEMETELEELITQYQQQQGALSAEAREAREDEIRQKEQEYQLRMQELEQEADQRRAQLVEPILEEMSETIESIRAEGNYTMIFDAAGQSIIAADPELDLTDQVIERLRQNAEGGTPDL